MIKLLATAAFGFGLAASSSAFAAEKTVTLAVQLVKATTNAGYPSAPKS